MNDIAYSLAAGGFTGVVGVIIGYICVKRYLKEELVNPDIERLDKDLKAMKADFEQKLADVKEDNHHLSQKLDKKFDELNIKLDKNSQVVSSMQGMLTVMFNGLRNGVDYGER